MEDEIPCKRLSSIHIAAIRYKIYLVDISFDYRVVSSESIFFQLIKYLCTEEILPSSLHINPFRTDINLSWEHMSKIKMHFTQVSLLAAA